MTSAVRIQVLQKSLKIGVRVSNFDLFVTTTTKKKKRLLKCFKEKEGKTVIYTKHFGPVHHVPHLSSFSISIEAIFFEIIPLLTFLS